MNEGSNNKLFFPRASGAELCTASMQEVREELEHWRSDKLPWQRQNVSAGDVIEAVLPLPNDLVRIVDCDGLTVASDLKMLPNMQNVSIAMVCSCGSEPRGRVLQGEQGCEEELHRRTDIDRHNQRYLQNDWPYPLRVTDMNKGQALLYDNVLCYRDNEHHGYGIRKQPTFVSVIMAAPRRLASDSGDTYTFDDDRDYMYCTLRAIFKAAQEAGAEVLVLPDFGCADAGHPPREVASLMYKVVHEYCGQFKSVIVAIAPQGTDAKRTTSDEFSNDRCKTYSRGRETGR